MSEIEKLAELKAKGIITAEEFEAKKHQMLFGGTGGPVIHEREIVREIVKVPCAYCGVLMEITNVKCPNCGAPINQFHHEIGEKGGHRGGEKVHELVKKGEEEEKK
jgi:rubrerythrin